MSTYKYVFAGRIHPERADLNLVFPVSVHFKLPPEIGVAEGEVTCTIMHSQIIIGWESNNKIDPQEVFTLKNEIEYYVQSLVNFYGFASGRFYEVEIISMSDPENNHNEIVFGVELSGLKKEEQELYITVNKLFDIIISGGSDSGKAITLITDNYRRAMKYPNDTGFHCYRIVELIKDYFKTGKTKAAENQAWQKMYEQVGFTKDDIKLVFKHGGEERHGKHKPITGQRRVEILKVTQGVIDKYIAYLENKLPKQRPLVLVNKPS